MAFCGEASLDQQYLTLLGSVAAGGEQRMLLQNGGAATK